MANKKAANTKTTKKTAAKPAASKVTKTKVTTVKAAATKKASKPVGKLRLLRTSLLNASLAEFIGTFLLVTMVLLTRNEPIYMMFGLIGVALAFAVLSGVHLNPAISIGAWVTRKIDGIRALTYTVAQVLGAMLAFVVVSAYVNGAPGVSEQAAMFGQQAAQIFTAAQIPSGSEWGVFFAEVLGLSVLGFAYASAYKSRERVMTYGLTIGAGLFVGLLVASGLAGYLTGTAVLNPAAAISVQALEWALWPLMAYIVAPVVGAVIGFSLHKLLLEDAETTSKKATR